MIPCHTTSQCSKNIGRKMWIWERGHSLFKCGPQICPAQCKCGGWGYPSALRKTVYLPPSPLAVLPYIYNRWPVPAWGSWSPAWWSLPVIHTSVTQHKLLHPCLVFSCFSNICLPFRPRLNLIWMGSHSAYPAFFAVWSSLVLSQL